MGRIDFERVGNMLRKAQAFFRFANIMIKEVQTQSQIITDAAKKNTLESEGH